MVNGLGIERALSDEESILATETQTLAWPSTASSAPRPERGA